MSVVRDPSTGPMDFITDCCKSIFTLTHVFSTRPKAPPFSFSLFLLLWAAFWTDFYGGTSDSSDLLVSRWALPEEGLQKIPESLLSKNSGSNSNGNSGDSSSYKINPADGTATGVLNNNSLFQSLGLSSGETNLLARALLHWIVPVSGFLRTCLIGTHVLILGYTYEVSSLGTATFMTRFLSSHLVLILFISFLKLGVPGPLLGITSFPTFGESQSADSTTVAPPSGRFIVGIEPTLACLQVLFAFDNPIVPNHLVSDDWLRLKTAVIEPRWHGWLVLMALCFSGPQPWSWTFYRYGLGAALGSLFVLRFPSSWGAVGELWKREKWFVSMLVVWGVALMRWPVTGGTFTMLHFLLSPSQWFQSSPNSFVNIALFQEAMPEALSLISIALCGSPLSLCLLNVGPAGSNSSFSWVKKVYGGISVILAMSIMNSGTWAYVDVGFLVLLGGTWVFLTS